MKSNEAEALGEAIGYLLLLMIERVEAANPRLSRDQAAAVVTRRLEEPREAMR